MQLLLSTHLEIFLCLQMFRNIHTRHCSKQRQTHRMDPIRYSVLREELDPEGTSVPQREGERT